MIGFIPARYASTRLRGKPLQIIGDKPMIYWVYQTLSSVMESYVLTDSREIGDVCEALEIPHMITCDHPTGTDRVASVINCFDGDDFFILNGDEPLVLKKDIERIVEEYEKERRLISAFTTIDNPVTATNPTSVKIAINSKDEIVYMSRYPIPFPKDRIDYDMYKSVGAWTFRREDLEFFKSQPQDRLELIEGIETLRFLANGRYIKGVQTTNKPFSVDTYKDLESVRKVLCGD